MRIEYYKFLNEEGVLDYLKDIPELPYSFKLKLLKFLRSKFEPKIINLALIKYKDKYIKENRVDLKALKNIIYGMCKKEIINK